MTEGDLAKWRDGLKRGGRGKKSNPSPLSSATLARLMNDFRAALNRGARKAKASGEVLVAIKHGLEAPAAPDRVREKQVLTDTEVRLLLECAEQVDRDFGALVLLLGATGARFSQLAAARVSNFQAATRRIMLPVSNKGKGAKQVTHVPVPLTDDVIARIRPLADGRASHEPLLMRWHHRQVAGDPTRGILPAWERAERRPWTDAGEMTRHWAETIRLAALPASLVPYCLRHSSIVRMLRANVPVSLVAKSHDTSAAMIHKHYGAFIVDASEDILRRATLSLG